MNSNPNCEKCGTPLAAFSGSDGARPECPTCLLGLGWQHQAVTQDWAPEPPESVMDRVPDVAQLVAYFPNLEIQHLIGYGGMGAVYQARQPHLDRTVALKILSPRLSRNPAFAQRFMREARTLAKLAHPNIVMVFEFGQAGPLHYLLLEFVDGINLRDAMLEGRLSTAEALAIVPQLCDALQYAHDEGIVHRDIKPENILLDKKGRVKIADFGLAKLIQPNAEDLRLTGTKQVLGTLSYMAPEQIEGRSTIDHRADIYSLGVVFYELLTGELPLGRFAVPSEKKPVDARLDQVVLRTLEKEPQRRYQHASEVKSAMQDISVVEATAIPHPTAYEGTGFNQPPRSAMAGAGLPQETLPFSIDNVNYGFADAQGLLKTCDQGLAIEFEVRDAVFQRTISKPKSLVLPRDEIVSVKYQEGMMSDSLLIQATSMTATAEIPEARGGCATLKIKKVHRPEAQRLVARFQRGFGSERLDAGAWSRAESAAPWVVALRRSADHVLAQLPWRPGQRAINPLQVSARFSSVQFWFVTCGVLNFVLLSGSLRRKFHDLIMPLIAAPERSSLYPVAQWLREFDSVINPFSTQFGNGYFTQSVILSILLFIAAEKLKYLKHYVAVAVICGIALLPFYPTYILCAPWALSALVMLLLPSSIVTFDAVDAEGKVTAGGWRGKVSEPTGTDLWMSRPLTHIRRLVVTFAVIVAGLGLVAVIAVNHSRVGLWKSQWTDHQSEGPQDAVTFPAAAEPGSASEPPVAEGQAETPAAPASPDRPPTAPIADPQDTADAGLGPAEAGLGPAAAG